MTRLEKEIQKYHLFLKAIVEIFHPLVEIAVHDVKKKKIVAIYNNLTRRKIGDPSLLNQIDLGTDYYPPYHKKNSDKRVFKSSSITIRDENKKPIGIICINVEIALFFEVAEIIEKILYVRETSKSPIERYRKTTLQQITAAVEQFLHEEQLTLRHLKSSEKKKLVLYLEKKGILNLKNAVPLIADKLRITRATVYNHLKE